MPHAIVRHPNDVYFEFPYYHSLTGDGIDRYSSTADLLSTRMYTPGEIRPLCATYPSWVLAEGILHSDFIFVGHTTEASILIYGEIRSWHNYFLRDLAENTFIIDDDWGYMEWGNILRSPNWSGVAPYLLSQGVLPKLPNAKLLNHVHTPHGKEYWGTVLA